MFVFVMLNEGKHLAERALISLPHREMFRCAQHDIDVY